MFDKQKILNSINGEIRESLQILIKDILCNLRTVIIKNGYIPKRKILSLSPFPNGYSEESHVFFDLESLIIPKMYSLESYNHCFQIFSENEIFKSQNLQLQLVLTFFVIDYLEDVVPTKDTFDLKKFNDIFEKYIGALLSMTYESVSVCPLIGFESDTDSIKLDDDLIIRKITKVELDEIWNLSSTSDFGGDFKLKLASTKYVIEHRVINNKGSYAYSSSDLTPIVVLSMRLFKSGDFLANCYYDKILLPWMIKATSVSGNGCSNGFFLDSYNYSLCNNEIIELKRIFTLAKKFHLIRNKTKYKYVLRAIEWFDRYFNEVNIEHRFIFLMLLMEALCSENYETLHKLENRISLIIGEDDENRLSVRRDFHKLYDGPRKIIHGHDVEINTNDLKIAEDFSRRLLKKYIVSSLNGHGRQELVTCVDDALISQSKREEMCKFFDLNVNELEFADNIEYNKLYKYHFLLKDELFSIKDDMNNLNIYDLNIGFIYKLIQFNSLENRFDTSLWVNIVEFYDSYFKYLELLKTSSDLVKSLISETVHKIKTEKDEEVWVERYIEKVKKTNPFSYPGPKVETYGIDQFLRSDKIKEIPEISEDMYLSFDNSSQQWDLKITLEDLTRSNKSMKEIIQEIHELVKDKSSIIEFRECRNENLKLIANLIKLLDRDITLQTSEYK